MVIPGRCQPVIRAFLPILRVSRGPIRPPSRIHNLLHGQRQVRYRFTSPDGNQRRVPLSRHQPNTPDSQIHHEVPPDQVPFENPEPQPGPTVELDALMFEEAKAGTRYLSPAIFAVCFSASVFVGLAYLQARSETKAVPKPASQIHNPLLRPPPTRTITPTEAAARIWADLNPVSKVTLGIMGTSGIVHLFTAALPHYKAFLAHTPAFNRNWTLVSSTFVHFGLWHLALNMWGIWNFMAPVGFSPLFNGNPYHLLAFFLSTGALSGYGHHLATLPTKPLTGATLIRSGGASGAIFALFAAFCTQYPTAQLGIVFVPFSIAAINMLPAAMVFDLVGMVRGYKFVNNMAHAAHLSGALIGIAYSMYNGRVYIWDPIVNFWRRQLKKSS